MPIYTFLSAFFSGKFVGKVRFLNIEISYFEFYLFSFFLGMAYTSFIDGMDPRILIISRKRLLEESVTIKYLSHVFIYLTRKLMRYFVLIAVFSLFFKFPMISFLLLYFSSIYFAVPLCYLLLSIRLILKKESETVIYTLSDFLRSIFPIGFSLFVVLPKNFSRFLILFPPISSFEAARMLLILKDFESFTKIFFASALINLVYIVISRKVFQKVFEVSRKKGWIKLE